jgi:tetratricopeptide (TPR) repeat protein
MVDEALEQYPEAIPLHRVAPGWRIFAVLAGLATLGLLVLIIFMGMRLAILAASSQLPPPPVPATMVVAGPVVATPLDDDEAREPGRGDLPYPVREDLRRSVDGEPAPAAPSPRQRFLKLTQLTWTAPSEQSPQRLSVSPDGQSLACFREHDLIIGPFNALQVIDLETPNEMRQRSFRGVPPVPVETYKRKPELRPIGVPAWAADSQSVFFANAGGHMFRLTVADQILHPLDFRGHMPVPVPNDANKLVFVRSRPSAKVALATTDAREIVVANLETQQVRVLGTLGQGIDCNALAVSPNGSEVVVAFNGPAQRAGAYGGLCVFGLGKNKVEFMGPEVAGIRQVAWTPDGTGLIYARKQDPVPLDCTSGPAEDLFQWDIAARKETRLSRGGGFRAPTVTDAGELFFLTQRTLTGHAPRTTLQQVPLAAVRKFAAKEPEATPHGAGEWTALLVKVCADAKVPADADGAAFDAETRTRLVDQFRRQVRERFQEEVPDTADGLDRLGQRLQALDWTPADRAVFVRVFATVQGDYLCRKHGATWQLSAGPLTRPQSGARVENTFACAVNLFQRPALLETLLRHADGRALILVNDLHTGRDAIAARDDPDLVRAGKLLREENQEEGEGLLLQLADRGQNRSNHYLLVEIGRLLYESGRKAAVQKLVGAPDRRPDSAGLFNLLGLLQLEAEPRQAITTFKRSLRCDLQYGPAYVNLAQAYAAVGDTAAARACLRRYLEVLPDGPLVPDVLERIGKLQPISKE